VDVIYAQAPLFSTNPKIGKKLEYLNLYHSSLLFAQGNGSSRQYWTLEFDFTGGNLLKGVVPEIVDNGSSSVLKWDTAARYCLTPKLLWGRHHWSKRFEVLMSLTPDQVMRAFDEFLFPLNSTQSLERPQYQLWRVAKVGILGQVKEVLVNDVTCQDGAVWFLNHLTTVSKVKPFINFRLKATATLVYASRIVPVNTRDPMQWKRVVEFYKTFSNMLQGNTSIFHKLVDVAEIIFDRKYIYDSNAGVYYEIHGNHVPWIQFGYPEFPLRSPPWLEAEHPQSSPEEQGMTVVV
jgi:hypothetical protein